MGHIKEPKGVDFVIQSEPLTEKDRQKISQFIVAYKEKNKSRKSRTSALTKSGKQKSL